jgi:hypothetical protein
VFAAVTWGPCLHEEIVHLFREAQSPMRCRVAVWLDRRYRHRLAQRRETYDAHRYFRDSEYEAQLARARARSRKRVAERTLSYLSFQARKTKIKLAARTARVAGKLCPECGAPVPPGHTGPTPTYCSIVCNRRRAGRNWWRRNKVKHAS